jgi:tRNA threonylcarbamoyladenosine biosynthesis protein TsaE
MQFIMQTPEQTRNLGLKIGALCPDTFTLLLEGDLGSGKTCFVQGVAAGCGVPDSQPVCSPTYTLMNHYTGRCDLYHFDLYRLSGVDELEDLGFDEYFSGSGIKVVEWSGLFKELNESGLHIAFSYGANDNERVLSLTAYGTLGLRLVQRLSAEENARTDGAN